MRLLLPQSGPDIRYSNAEQILAPVLSTSLGTVGLEPYTPNLVVRRGLEHVSEPYSISPSAACATYLDDCSFSSGQQHSRQLSVVLAFGELQVVSFFDDTELV